MPSEEEFLNILKKKEPVKLTYDSPFKIKYFFLKRSDLQIYLKSRLDSSKTSFKDLLKKDFKPANSQCKESFYTYGMIYVNSEKDLYIYNDKLTVKLNFEFFRRYSLFNGQLVAIKGKNFGNNELMVENVHCMPCLDYEETKSNLNCTIKIIGQPSEKINYKSDIVIFIGCDVPENLKKDNSAAYILHIPTMEEQDCIEMYPMNPKPNDKNICVSLNNPCSFKINEKLFCVNTLKVLDLLNDMEIVENENIPKNDPCGDLLFSEDKIQRLCYHLIFQRSFLPILDVKKVKYDFSCLHMPVAPDFYIIRSDLFDPFCRDVGPTKVINIGTKFNWDINISGKTTKMDLLN
ncbi:DNA polymerase alpha subunit B [Vairimorpha necatrix]|uniref:DNA polymerase alpha subunit B n=1 Tax=Vairimorpha necatrix TaxID=6039 RepID=A0AAX4JE79_9MICR